MFEKVLAAAKRLEGVAHKTPVLTSRLLDEHTGNVILLKCENFQRMGAFKFRGAFNAISALPPEIRGRGIVTYSSGNHAQGVAAAAALFGMHAVIIMPSDAPRAKIEGTRSLGAEIILYDRQRDDREAIAAMKAVTRTEGILPALETSHAVAALPKLLAGLEGSGVGYAEDSVILVGFSGRGDKDMAALERFADVEPWEAAR